MVTGARPSASLQVSGRRVRVHMQVDTTEGAPVADVASAVRSHVTAQLARLAGVDVAAVDVHVAGVVPSPTHHRSVS